MSGTVLKIITSLLSKGRTRLRRKGMVLLTCLLRRLTSSHISMFFNLIVNLCSTFTIGFIDLPEMVF